MAYICYQMSVLILSPRIKEIYWPACPPPKPRSTGAKHTYPPTRRERPLEEHMEAMHPVVQLTLQSMTSSIFQVHQAAVSENVERGSNVSINIPSK